MTYQVIGVLADDTCTCWADGGGGVKIGMTSRAQRRLDRATDDGFTLVEVVVAMMLTVVVMTGTAGFFIRSLAATRLMQQRQSAVAAGQQAMEVMRAKSVVDLALAAVQPPVTVTGGSDYRVANIDYRVTTAVTPCAMPSTGALCNPDPTLITPSNMMYLIDVGVKWTPCSQGGCTYTVTTLRDSAPPTTEHLREVPRS